MVVGCLLRDVDGLGLPLLQFLLLIKQLLLLPTTAGHLHDHLATQVTGDLQHETVLQILSEISRLVVFEVLVEHLLLVPVHLLPVGLFQLVGLVPGQLALDLQQQLYLLQGVNHELFGEDHVDLLEDELELVRALLLHHPYLERLHDRLV
jgi:hypothetical protein